MLMSVIGRIRLYWRGAMKWRRRGTLLATKHSALWLSRVRIQFQVPVEVIPPAFRRIADADGDGNDGTPARLHRPFFQLHAGFLRRAAAFLVVASPTGRHDVLPRLLPSLGDGHDVIERQFFRPEPMGAVLAGIAVARKNVDTGKLDGAVAVFQPDQLKQPHDRRELDREGNAVNLTVVDFEHFNFALPEERDRFLPMDDPEGFIGRIQEKSHFHAIPSFPTVPPYQRRPSGVPEHALLCLCHKPFLKSSKGAALTDQRSTPQQGDDCR
jgi:hypothetical protein